MRADTALALIALACRLFLLRTTLAPVDSDQAVAGLMARHILRGDRPIFFYGQAYNGALEEYLTAGVFRLWSASNLTLRLVPVVLSVVLVLQVYILARRLYGPALALAAGLWLALPPAVLGAWSLAAGAGYVEATVLGTGLLLIAVRRWGLGQPRRYDRPLLGFLAGLGVWAQPMIADYVVALAGVGAVWAWRRRARLRCTALLHLPLAGVFFLLGGAPWLAYTLQHDWASLAVLTYHARPWSWPDLLHPLGSETMPVPTGYADQFARYVASHALPYALALIAGVYIAVRLVLSPRGLVAQARAILARDPLADAPLAALVVSVIVLYLASRFKTLPWTTRNPRYLLPLYTATPYLLACTVRTLGRHRATACRAETMQGRTARLSLWATGTTRRPVCLVGFACVLAVVAINIYGDAHYADLPSTTMPRVAPLVARLLARGDAAVFADYWVAWRLAFASGERLIPVPIVGIAVDRNPRGARYPPDWARAARARRWAYILPAREVPLLAALLRRAHVPFHRWRWGTSSLFFNHWDWGAPAIVDGPVRAGFPMVWVGSHR